MLFSAICVRDIIFQCFVLIHRSKHCVIFQFSSRYFLIPMSTENKFIYLLFYVIYHSSTRQGDKNGFCSNWVTLDFVF